MHQYTQCTPFALVEVEELHRACLQLCGLDPAAHSPPSHPRLLMWALDKLLRQADRVDLLGVLQAGVELNHIDGIDVR